MTDAATGAYTVEGDFDQLSLGETATISFDYVATDDSANAANNTSDAQTITLTLEGSNDTPTIYAYTETIDVAEHILTGSISTADVMTADIDTNDEHSFVVLTNAATNVIATDATDIGDITVSMDTAGAYTLAGAGIDNNLGAGESATVTFDVQVIDDSADGATDTSVAQTITLTIEGSNDTPARTEGYNMFFPSATTTTITGTEADDFIWGADAAGGIDGSLGNDVLIGNAGADDPISGGDGHDVIWGGAAADIIYGDAGNDIMWGGAGADHMSGGAGNDFLDGGAAADMIYGYAGDDTIVYDAADAITVDGGIDEDTLILSLDANATFTQLYTVPVNFEILDLTKNGNHTISGNITSVGVQGLTDVNNALTILKDAGDIIGLDATWGKATTSTVMANGVSSTMASYTNDDTISTLNIIDTDPSTDATHQSQDISLTPWLGGDGHDLITGSIGIDTMVGGAGDDIMYGGAGVDTMSGDAGNDILIGGTGKDILDGGTGSDVMHGGGDGNTFKWDLSDIGNDFISDFKNGNAATDDVLELELELSDLLESETSDATILVNYLSFEASAGTNANPSGGTLITVDTNGNATPGGRGQTITLENITHASWGAYADSTSDFDIITKMLSDESLIVNANTI
jgi:VCBS repeat-containing protein